MFLRVSQIYHFRDIFDKSQTQPGSGEGCSNITSGTPVAPVKKVAPKGVLQMHGATYRNRVEAVLVGRVRNTGQSPLTTLGQ